MESWDTGDALEQALLQYVLPLRGSQGSLVERALLHGL